MGLIYFSTKSKVKPKRKSKKERAQYEEWCAKLGIDSYGKKSKKNISRSTLTIPSVYRRETPYYPSKNTIVTGAVNTGVTKKVYTGDKMIGIAAMHKSNLVPIFNDDSAKDVASMRR